MVIFVAALSIGAWWDLNNPKKETRWELQKETQEKKVQEKTQEEVKEGVVFEPTLPRYPTPPKREIQGAVKLAKPLPSQPEEVERVRAELRDIIERTNQLQVDLKENRAEIQNILEQTKIHQKILQNISIPQPVQIKSQINADEIIKREKLRLIAEQAQQTQEQLRIIQQTRSVKAPYQPTGSRTSETS